MPTYEFRCEAGHTFDRFLKMSEAPLELACVECGKPATRQMSGGAGLVFKGSGFYLTDYGRAGQKPRAAEGSTAAGGDSKGGDSKPAKTESASTPAATAAPAKSDKSSSTKSSKSSE
jgi:putative FmdB family regulatory protein